MNLSFKNTKLHSKSINLLGLIGVVSNNFFVALKHIEKQYNISLNVISISDNSTICECDVILGDSTVLKTIMAPNTLNGLTYDEIIFEMTTTIVSHFELN